MSASGGRCALSLTMLPPALPPATIILSGLMPKVEALVLHCNWSMGRGDVKSSKSSKIFSSPISGHRNSRSQHMGI